MFTQSHMENMSLESLLEAEASSIFSLVVDFLCFLVWNMGIMLLHPVKSTQLAYFDAVMYGGPQVSRQNFLLTAKHQFLTAKHQFLTAKHQFLTAKHQFLTAKHQFLTAKHQFLTAKLQFLTAKL